MILLKDRGNYLFLVELLAETSIASFMSLIKVQ